MKAARSRARLRTEVLPARPSQETSTAELSGEASRDRQITPGFHRRLGLPDVFEECGLAVKAAPAAGLEQFGEVLQPLLGKIAPARKDIAAASHVESLCHEAARKEKNGRRRNRTKSIERDRDILWKTFPMSSERARPAPSPDKTREDTGFLARRLSARKSVGTDRPQMERPARGDNRTGQAIYGRWGGWALAPDTAVGRGYQSHTDKSRQGGGTFKTQGTFFNRSAGSFAGLAVH